MKITADDGKSQKTTLNRELKTIMAKIGLPPISVHCLIHTFATRCIERGVQPNVLQKLLGHAHLSTTMDLYVHVTEESLEKGIRLLEAI